MESATLKPIENLLWNEFLRNNRRRLEFWRKRTAKCKSIAEELHAPRRVILKIEDMLSCEIPVAIEFLSKIEKEMNIGERLDLVLHWNFKDMVSEIESAHSDMLKLLLQPFFWKGSSLLTEGTQNPGTSALKKCSRFLKTPNQTYNAVKKIMENCLVAIYGKNKTLTENIEPLVLFWLHSYYRFLPFSGTICMPSHDSRQLCQWAFFAHETLHSKIYNVNSILDKKKTIESSGRREAIEKFDGILNHLLPNPYERIIEKWNILERRFIETMQRELGKINQKLTKKLGNDFRMPHESSFKCQFLELICDLGSTKVAGPCNTVLSACLAADNLRNPALDVCRHFHCDVVHPPDKVRIKFQLLQLGHDGLMSKEIEDLERLVDDLMGVDFLTGPKNIEKEIVEYLDKYYHILTQENCGTTSLVKEMQDLVEDFVDADYCYNSDRWNTVVNCAKDADLMESNWKHLYPYDFVNAVWLRLLEFHKRSPSYKEYLKEYETAKSFLQNIWEKLLRCDFSRPTHHS